MLTDRQMVHVDQQLLDRTGNSLGIEYASQKFCKQYLCEFANRPHHEYFGHQIFWLHKLLCIEYRCHTKMAECTKDETAQSIGLPSLLLKFFWNHDKTLMRLALVVMIELWNTVEPPKYLIYNKRLLHLLCFKYLLVLLSTVLNTFSNCVRFRFAWFGKVLNRSLTQSAEHSVQLATQFIVLRVWGNNYLYSGIWQLSCK